VRWISGDNNPVDAMMKSKACPALKELIDTNTIDTRAAEWVERAPK
jgi:hypothetical protein